MTADRIHPLKIIIGSFTAIPIFLIILIFAFLKWAIRHLIRLLGKLFCTFDALKWYLGQGSAVISRLEFNKTLSDLDRKTAMGIDESKLKTKTS